MQTKLYTCVMNKESQLINTQVKPYYIYKTYKLMAA